ncbi:type III-B CRISPR module-associated protein Cmr5 [Thermobifida alba]|uniref:type III-B CRISPR module-associated protein Cmr5 n=1 Tax=Thermobifida alba TaxID=53522 RepID=UPI0031ED7C31
MDQQMAAQAERVIGPVVTNPQLAKRLRTRMRQFPMRLRSSGLVAAFAFAESRSGNGDPLEQAYTRLCEVIIQHVSQRDLLPGLTAQSTPREFLTMLTNAGLTTYSRVSAEIDLLAGWLSRIADAYYGKLAAAARAELEETTERTVGEEVEEQA